MFWDAKTKTSQPIAEFPVNVAALRPSVSDTRDIVFRAGDDANSPINVWSLAGGAVATHFITPSQHFSSIGRSPSVSSDGRVIAFYGVLTPSGADQLNRDNGSEAVPLPLTPGPGIFLSTVVDGKRRLVRVAGVGATSGLIGPGDRRDPVTSEISGPDFNFDGRADWSIASLDPDSMVSVSSLHPYADASRGAFCTVVFAGTDSANSPPRATAPRSAIFSTRVNFIQYKTHGKDMITVGAQAPLRVARSGDSIESLGVVSDLRLHRSVNLNGDVAFWAAAGNLQGIVKATPNSKWLLDSPGLHRSFYNHINKQIGFDPDSPLVEYVVPGTPGETVRLSTNQVILHATGGNKLGGLQTLASNKYLLIDSGKALINSKSVGIHYLVTRDGQVIQITPEANVANHASSTSSLAKDNPNAHSIGIEIVDDGRLDAQSHAIPPYGHRYDPAWMTPIQKAKVALLVRDICHRNDIFARIPEPLPALYFPPGGDRTGGADYRNTITGNIDASYQKGTGIPIPVRDSAETNPTTPVTIPVTSNDIAGDTDDTLTVTIVKNASHGQAKVSGGSIIYTPRPGTPPVQNWHDFFSYKLTGNQIVSSKVIGNVSITVAPTNQARPTSRTMTAQAIQAERASIIIRDGFAPTNRCVITHGQVLNRTHGKDDPNPNMLPFRVLSSFVQGAVNVSAQDDSDTRYGFATLSSLPSDPLFNTVDGDLGVTIDDTVTVLAGGQVQFDVLDNDILATDDSRNGAVVICEKPIHGIVEQSEEFPQLVTYTPDTAFTGDDVFTYRIVYENGYESAPATVRVAVRSSSDVADLDVAIGTDAYSVQVGIDITCHIWVWNHGPGAARNSSATLRVPNDWEFLRTIPPATILQTNSTGFNFHMGTLEANSGLEFQLVFRPKVGLDNRVVVNVMTGGADLNWANNTSEIFFPPTTVIDVTRPELSISRISEDTVFIELLDRSGLNYELHASTNLIDWSLLGILTNNNNNGGFFIESGNQVIPRRFYRAKSREP